MPTALELFIQDIAEQLAQKWLEQQKPAIVDSVDHSNPPEDDEASQATPDEQNTSG